MSTHKIAFPPIVGDRPKTLILGSMPGEASLRRQQYYGHPSNAFWPIMAGLLGIAPNADYAERTAALVAAGIALWDVMAECERRGSLDTAIRPASIRVNDFQAFFDTHTDIDLVAFNGGTAEREYHRRVQPGLSPAAQTIATCRLPSTSPAYAGMSLADKARAWHAILAGRFASSAS
ncbi:G:T/U mismatch-specific DNA glycosylase [Thioflavicoccus mobilis 8321]|uniref:G:T/U mismatch-specific DNA glycosylase n=1 Tax=Thioflavicoccus mobilis 8321 TaxID=765912 RepID=L0GZ00_9GAMM|nr:DNA-deoxyinosine glycosylase [Thioflavicoccus mobilis]AGA91968.1 G:T/U mismatch-specific DNA glycosylase [Thioflavicoccus mobilis 8321]